jgi:hypothetical protein
MRRRQSAQCAVIDHDAGGRVTLIGTITSERKSVGSRGDARE